jgi:cell division initiation protein
LDIEPVDQGDLIMALTPDEVLQQTFKEKWKGYDPVEVDAFLERVMASLAELHEERDRLARRVEERTEGPDESELLTRTLVTAQRAADETLAQAQQEAERILDDARADAARMIDEAEQRIVAARDRLDVESSRVSRAAESLVRFRTEYRARVQSVIADQLALLDQAGELPDIPSDIAALATFAEPAQGRADELEMPQSVLQSLTEEPVAGTDQASTPSRGSTRAEQEPEPRDDDTNARLPDSQHVGEA